MVSTNPLHGLDMGSIPIRTKYTFGKGVAKYTFGKGGAKYTFGKGVAKYTFGKGVAKYTPNTPLEKV